MTGHLPNLPSSMREPDFMELVWENGEVLIRGLSSKKTKYSSLSSSRYLSQTSKDGVADSTLADPISGVSSLTKQQLVDSNSVQVNKLKEKKTRVDEDKDRAPQALLESNHPSSGATRAGFVRPLPPNRSNPFENDGNFMAKKKKSILQPDSELKKREPFPGEQSEALRKPKLASNNTWYKGNPEQIAASSSFCSRGASNCPVYTLERRYEEDTDDLSEDTAMEEEPEKKKKGIKGGKRKRKTEVHILSERKRRDKINKKMCALKELIPNCNKVDKASMLDEAIEYLKNLQFQVQMMSIGSGVYMQPMMLPSPSMQHMNAQHLGGYSPMIGMRMQMGLGCCVPPHFPSPLMPGTAALPWNPAARVNMFGFPDEVLSRSMSCSPFVSSAGSFTPQSIHLHGAGVSQSAAATAVMGQVNLPGGVNSVSTWKDMNPTQLTQ